MKKIIIIMQHDRLILPPIHEFEDLIIDINANRAASLGYRKFKREQRWDSFFSNPIKILIALSLLALFIAGFIYLLIHYFRK